jgi:hypothetical protein
MKIWFRAFITIVFCCTLFVSCSTKQPPNKLSANNIFVNKYLPQIRDAFCAKTLALQSLDNISKGKKSHGHAPNGIDWAELSIDSTDSSITISVFLDSNKAISFIRFNFPFDLWHKEQMITIFGQYSTSKMPKMKDGSLIDFHYGKDCPSPKSVIGWLNVTGSLRSVSMQDVISVDSSK